MDFLKAASWPGGVAALWLVPRKDQFEFFKIWIHRFAEQVGAPPFEPHITVTAGEWTAGRDVSQSLAVVLAGLEPLALEMGPVRQGQDYFQSLFVEMNPHERLIALHQRMESIVGFRANHVLRPHLSLAYGRLSRQLKTALLEEWIPPFRKLVCDELRVVAPTNPRLGWRDIAGWRMVYSAKLQGGP